MVKKNRGILQQIFQLFSVITVFFIILTPNALADTLDSEQIKALLEETRALRKEVTQLKKQLTAHTSEHKKQPIKKQKPRKLVSLNQKQRKKQAAIKKTHIKENKNTATKRSEKQPKSDDSKTSNKSQNLRTLGGFFPIVAPYLGNTPNYSGSDLLTNLSQQNANLLALQYREEIENAFSKQKLSEYYLILSGTLGAQISAIGPYFGRSNSDIDLTTANITALAGVGKWVTGFFSFDYDSLPLNGLNPPQFGPRIGNSRIYLDEGFITIGNLKQSNWYASVGQMYLPFGQYNSFTINSPLTSSLFTTSERPLIVGYSHSTGSTELDAVVYVYQGDTVTSTKSSAINEWGASINYLISNTQWNGGVGIAYITNVADSEGIQLNSQNAQFCTVFGGFAFPCQNTNVLVHRVPGFDIYGNLTIGSYTFVSEYITATRAFAPINMTFNRQGAKPQAFDLEGSYAFNVYDKPSSISVGYAFTKDALALLLPAKEYSVTFTTSLWRHTTESLGFQHDINYGSLTTATGQGLPIYFLDDRINLGKSSNTLILAINAYF